MFCFLSGPERRGPDIVWKDLMYAVCDEQTLTVNEKLLLSKGQSVTLVAPKEAKKRCPRNPHGVINEALS